MKKTTLNKGTYELLICLYNLQVALRDYKKVGQEFYRDEVKTMLIEEIIDYTNEIVRRYQNEYGSDK